MSHIRAAARKNGLIARAVHGLDRIRNLTTINERRVLGAADHLSDFLQQSPLLSSRQSELTIDHTGTWLRVDAGSVFLLNHESWGLLTAPFEELERQEIIRGAAQSSVVFDVGANFGFHSVAVARAYPQLQVHAFEPVPGTADLLAANIARNGCRQVKVVRAAVSNFRGEMLITTEFTTGNYIASSERGFRSRTVSVPSVRLDDYWRGAGRPQVGFMKVDVEGAEWLVLDGARDFLRESRPTLLLELWDEWLQRFGKNRGDCIGLLQRCGYHRGRPVGAIEQWQSLDSFAFTAATNYVFEGSS